VVIWTFGIKLIALAVLKGTPILYSNMDHDHKFVLSFFATLKFNGLLQVTIYPSVKAPVEYSMQVIL
jgi:hypothetical protein